jgi:aspartyl-tRNA(Asn)/glutamyl-tRNA(Gln) amidotransferase subunit B
MRSKEEAHDYRYFPEPDLLPVEFGEGRIKAVLGTMPELPAQKIYRFCTDYGIPEYDARVLTQERELAEFYELVAKASNNPKAASNWVMGELLRELNSSKLDIAQSPVSETALADLIKLIDSKVISGKIAKTVFLEMWEQRKPADQIIKEKGLVQISDKGAIEKMIDEVLEANPDQLAQYREGKTKLYGFFVGEIMKLTKGQANPGIVNQILKSKLG